jgi:Spy/CpxP family protein refolding chaperone
MTKRVLLVTLLCCIALPAHAQRLGGAMGPPAFLGELFLPKIVMQHQSDIGLTAEQRDAITKEMAATEKKTLDLRWNLEQKSEQLAKLLAADKIDETAALARAGELMDMERQMKQAHLSLLIRIKNQLTPEQQQKLRALRPRGRLGLGLRRRFLERQEEE